MKKSSIPLFSRRLTGLIAGSVVSALMVNTALAGPVGGQVEAGSATISGQGTSNVQIQQSSNRVVINWDSFDTAAHDVVQFNQSSAHAIAVNRVTNGMPTNFLGTLRANGEVVLINQSGVIFGHGSHVDVNKLVVSTADIATTNAMHDNTLNFDRPGDPNAAIVNQGTIKVGDVGLVGFVAPHVENQGFIEANLGVVHLASGDKFTLDLAGDHLVNITVDDNVASQLVSNSGTIDGAKIYLTAAAARQLIDSTIINSGTLQADSATEKGGTIVLSSQTEDGVATGNVVLASGSVISAKGKTGGDITITGKTIKTDHALIDASGKTGGGKIRIGGGKHGGEGIATAQNTTIDKNTTIKADATDVGDGGDIVLWSDLWTDYEGSVSAHGGINGGNGGNAEISGKKLLSFDGAIDLTGANGGKNGTLLLDPEDVTIQTSAGAPAVTCTSGVCTPTGDSSVLTVAALQAALAGGNVEVNTGSTGSQTGNITVANSIAWSTGNTLLLDAFHNIIINSGATISNTYNTATTGNSLPVLLALRADNTGINNGGSFINNGTINFSGSKGAVSIFYDSAANGGTYTAGTQTANGSWAAPTNKSVSTQFTAYSLVNTVADLVAMGSNLAGKYALGTNIDGGGAAFNSNTPLGTFTGILDGQYGILTGGSAYGVSNLTMNSGAANVGLFGINNGLIRNLSFDMDVTASNASTIDTTIGILAGTNGGTIANVTTSGDVTYTYTGNSGINIYVGGTTGKNTGTLLNDTIQTGNLKVTNSNTGSNAPIFYMGGLAGQTTASATGDTSAMNVSYVSNSGATGASEVRLGSLLGDTNQSVTNSSSSGNVSITYNAGNTKGIAVSEGGLVGRFSGNAGAVMTNVSSTGTVYNESHGGSFMNEGGLVGYASGTGLISSSFATGDVTYIGSQTSNIYVGGLIGLESGSNATDIYATGNVNYTNTATSTATYYVGGLVGGDNSTITNGNTYGGTVTLTDATGGSAATTAGSAGGLVGILGINNAAGKIVNSSSTEDVKFIYKGTTTASGSSAGTFNIGGLAGGNISQTANSITGSSASGAVTADYFDASYAAKDVNLNMGGLIGQNGSFNAVAVNNSSATGDVTDKTKGSYHNIGGLIGFNNTNSLITDVFATGDVTYIGKASVQMGGLIGQDWGSAGLNNAYATGNVTDTFTGATGTFAPDYVGGLIGYMSNDILNNVYTQDGTVTVNYQGTGSSFHDTFMGGLVGDVVSGKITAATSSEDVTFNFQSNATGAGTLNIGGLVGQNATTTSGGISNSSASGNVLAQYGGGYTQGMNVFMGGFAGQNGGGGSTALTGSHASGNVTNYLNNTVGTITEDIGGFAGSNYSSITLSNVYATGDVVSTSATSTSVGGLLGQNSSAVDSSHATGNVSATYNGTGNGQLNIGGLVGNNNVTITNSYSQDGAITLTNNMQSNGGHFLLAFVGGLVGASYGNLTNDTSNENVTFVQKVDGNSGGTIALGGFAGELMGGTISGSTSSGTVSTQYFNASYNTEYANTYLGGFAGYTGNAPNITNSSSSGNVTNIISNVFNTFNYAGGFIGLNEGTGTITSSFATGDVSYTGFGNMIVGGLIGYSDQASAKIIDSYATGDVSSVFTGTVSGLTTYIGGLIGVNASTVSNSYAQTGTVTATDMNGGSVTHTTDIGGLIGQNSGTVNLGSTSSEATSYVYKGASTGTQTVNIGGLVGYELNSFASNLGTTTIAITNSSATNAVSADYFDNTYSAGKINLNIGGLVGLNGNNAAAPVTGSSASGQVSTGLTNGTINIGGLIGYNNTNSTVGGTSFATGDVIYTGKSGVLIGGLIGNNTNANSIVSSVYATGNVTDTYNGSTSATSYVGGLIGQNGGTVSNATTQTGTVTVIDSATGSAAATYGIGGLIGFQSAKTTSNSSSSQNVTYTNKSASSGTPTIGIGGFIGSNGSTTANSLNTNSASGIVTAQYFDGTYAGKNAVTYIGGFAGIQGAGSATSMTGSSATGDVNDAMNGGIQYIGGMLGYSSTSSTVDNSSSSGTVTYTGSFAPVIGGLIGFSYTGTSVTNSHSSSHVVYNGTTTSVILAGGLVGNFNSAGTISNSYATGDVDISNVQQTSSVGGLVGYAQNASGTITGSYATGNITLTRTGAVNYITNLGGLVGQNTGAITNSYTQTGSVNLIDMIGGSVSTTYYAGGLVGQNVSGVISGSHASMPVTYTFKGTSSGTQVVYLGGLVGYNASASANSINTSYATGAVSNVFAGTGNQNVTMDAGGLIGKNTGVVATSYATGNVTISSDQDTNIGGLIGETSNSISGSHATGNVTVTNIAKGSVANTSLLGGLVGYQSGGSISTSYASGNVNYIHKVTSSGVGVVGEGGLVGRDLSTGANSITKSYALGDVTAGYFDASYSSKEIQGGYGGLAGRIGNGDSVGVTQSFATGDVVVSIHDSSNNQYLGGLIGRYYSSGTIADSYAQGAVIYLGPDAPMIGGLVADSEVGGTIARSYATGWLKNAGFGSTVGGLVGYNNGGVTITDSYWDKQTTGKTTSDGGGTALTTTQLQAALQTNFSTSIWGIIAGVSYPYLKAIYGTTPQIISGTDYTDHGTTPVAAGTYINGWLDGSQLEGGSSYAGANGYYYYMLPAGSLNGTSSVLLTSSGGNHAVAFADKPTGNLTGFNLYNNYLDIFSGNTTMTNLLADLALTQGLASGSDYPYTNAGAGGLTLNSGINMDMNLTGVTFDIDAPITLSGGAVLRLIAGSTTVVTEDQAIVAQNLVMTSSGAGGSFFLDNSGNDFTTIAATGTNIVSVTDNNGFDVGSVGGVNGITSAFNGSAYLTSAGTVTQSKAISANQASFIGGTFNLTNIGNNITYVSSNVNTLNLVDNTDFASMWTANNVIGINAVNANLSSTGHVTENYAMTVTNLSLSGTGSYALTGTGNNIGTIAANTGSVSLNNGSHAIVVGTVNGTDGITTTGATNLVTTGAVTLNKAITAGGAGTSINIAGSKFTNNIGASALNPGAGRFLVWSADPGQDNRGGQLFDFKQYNATYGVTTSPASGNGFLYSISPVITVTANDATKIYGDANPTFGASYSGFIDGDTAAQILSGTPSLTTLATMGSDVGNYAITGSAGSLAASGYTIHYVDGNLSVTPASLTVTAVDQSKIYGDANPGFTLSYSGLKNGDDGNTVFTGYSLGTGADASSNVGDYAINLTGGSASNYNIITRNDGTMHVTPATLTITADDETKIYGDHNPGLTASYGGFKNGDTDTIVTGLGLNTGATDSSNVGNYAISASGASAGSNYTISYVDGNLSVTPASLTVTAVDKTKIYGDANPGLTISYSGLKNGDDGDTIFTGYALGTAADATSGVGGYAITLTGGSASNYTITQANGTLTVTPATLTVTADDKTKAAGAANPAFTVSYSGLQNGDSSSIFSGYNLDSVADGSSPAGSYQIALTGGSAGPNYSVVLVDGTLVVTPFVSPPPPPPPVSSDPSLNYKQIWQPDTIQQVSNSGVDNMQTVYSKDENNVKSVEVKSICLYNVVSINGTSGGGCARN